MKISYLQFLPRFLKLKENFHELEKQLRASKAELADADLVVLPEYLLSGPVNLNSLPLYSEQYDQFSIEENLAKLSKQFPKITFVMGSNLIKRENKFKNLSLVYKNGQIITEYAKKALIYNEKYVCDSDDQVAIFEVNGLKVGIAICWDLILPEIFRKYTGKVDLMIIPSFWGIGGNELQAKYSFSLEKKYYTELGVTRAYENSFALLFVNSVGKYQSSFYSDRMMGGSYFVVPPLGLIHKTNEKDAKKILSVELDVAALEQYKEYYCTDQDYFYYKTQSII